jgi:hypothetical protein
VLEQVPAHRRGLLLTARGAFLQRLAHARLQRPDPFDQGAAADLVILEAMP